MNPELGVQIERLRKDLGQKLSEVERIGERLNELGSRLRQEPWKWAISWLEYPSRLKRDQPKLNLKL
jgi:hypothetical protein